MANEKVSHRIRHVITTGRKEYNVPIDFLLWSDGTVTWEKVKVKRRVET